MPALSVSLNGIHLATVSTEGLNLLGFHAHGSVIQSEFASIYLSGGLYGEEKESKHLVWIDLREIAADDEVSITFLEHGHTTSPGKTLEELFPEEGEVGTSTPSNEEMLEGLPSRPRTRERFTFLVVPSSGVAITAKTEPTDHSFGFLVNWDWMQPERLRVSLSSNSLENIVKRTGGTDHARFFLQLGESVKFRVGA